MFINKLLLVLIISPFVAALTGKELLDFAVKQYTKAVHEIKTGVRCPSIGRPTATAWDTLPVVTSDFRVGFYPGILWYLYEYTNDKTWKELAITATEAEADIQYINRTHDIGFDIMGSFGNGYRLTKNEKYSKVIVTAANTLATRFNPKVGCTRSWNSKKPDQFIVIADNMMNLELLFEGSRLSGNKTLYDMAVSHTNVTIREHLRADYSHYQVVMFNETSGHVMKKYTVDGYADHSCWSQAQGWLVSGLTTAYRYTRAEYILRAAEGVAKYFIDKSPADGIPYWDYDVPHDSNHTYIPRDSSAAATAASGLIELYEFTKNDKYLIGFKRIMESLNGDRYRADAKPEYKIPALFLNGTTSFKKSIYDTAMIFGDYYYVKSFKYYLDL
ncbi:unnamed protein product [Medioppia subpectinata]|uniref:Glucuronyl hydrolase n=1 Tax=Medioppia subpectinata TaxID=1979941 RepID=A0A7R9KUR9_9ACAR|nr:unnamed protein product [Medioppia subpectinata]CAG2110229.1 unnamed protein product [Medioppia subpectinata]